MALKIVLIDNYDSFTWNLVDYFYRCGVQLQVIRNDRTLDQLKQLQVDALVLSPGPESPQKAGNLMQFVEHFHDKLPMFGICLGHQAIGEFFGANLKKGLKPMHGKISTIRILEKEGLYKDLPNHFDVVRYHSLVLDNLPADLMQTAISQEAELMSMRHVSLPICGVQYHPEAVLTQNGLALIKNWLDDILLS
jgi:anthranilate synthase/aminodeoxychorismate synthase-like glutamine amidotransferase